MNDMIDADFDGESEGWPAIRMRKNFPLSGNGRQKGGGGDAEGESLQK